MKADQSRRWLTGTACLYFFILVSVDYANAFTPTSRNGYLHRTQFRKENFHTLQENVKRQGGNSYSLCRQANHSEDTGKEEEKGVQEDSSWILTLLVPLWLIYVSNQWSRSSLYYLVDFSGNGDPLRAMNVDLNFDQGQYGFLASIAFTSLFAIASLGAGFASDRYNRKTLTIASAVSWSIATVGTSQATSYDEVVGWRIAMGLACAFATPTAYTLIAQFVPKDKSALASSLYGTGVALGGSLAALTVLLDSNVGWRNALLGISLFGASAAGVSFLTLPDDPKDKADKIDDALSLEDGNADADDDVSITSQISDVVATSRVQWIFLGSFLRFCSGLCIGVWSAPYYRMVFPDHQSDYAFAQAFITAICGISSGLLGGAIADRISSTIDADDDTVGPKLWVPVVGSLLAAPAWYLSVHSDSFETAMAFLAVEYLVAECWFGPTINVLQTTVGPKIGGTAQGMFTVTGAVGNLAPSILGFLYGQATGTGSESSSALSDLLATAVCAGYVSSAACFALGALSTPKTDPAD